MNARPLTRLPVAAGAEGVAAVAQALHRRWHEDGPAFLPVRPGDDRTVPDSVAPETGLVITTSGSSGEALPVEIPLTALQTSARIGAEALGPAGHWLTAVPVTGIGGMLTVARAMAAEVEATCWPGVGGRERFRSASFLATAKSLLNRADSEGRPAYVSLVPTQLLRIVQAGGGALHCLGGFAGVLVGGAALSPGLRSIARAAGVRVVATYGATETCGGVVFDGVPLPEVSVEVEPGRPGSADSRGGTITVGGPTIASGYLGHPALSAERFVAGRFRSNDRGVLADGRLTILGRDDDTIKVGGAKIALPAVTAIIVADDRVLDAVTGSRSDPEWGRVPVSFVVARHRDSAGTLLLEAELRDRIRQRLGGAAVPRVFAFVDHLPEGPGGKPTGALEVSA